jgi:hypothetical protein
MIRHPTLQVTIDDLVMAVASTNVPVFNPIIQCDGMTVANQVWDLLLDKVHHAVRLDFSQHCDYTASEFHTLFDLIIEHAQETRQDTLLVSVRDCVETNHIIVWLSNRLGMMIANATPFKRIAVVTSSSRFAFGPAIMCRFISFPMVELDG